MATERLGTPAGHAAYFATHDVGLLVVVVALGDLDIQVCHVCGVSHGESLIRREMPRRRRMSTFRLILGQTVDVSSHSRNPKVGDSGVDGIAAGA